MRRTAECRRVAHASRVSRFGVAPNRWWRGAVVATLRSSLFGTPTPSGWIASVRAISPATFGRAVTIRRDACATRVSFALLLAALLCLPHHAHAQKAAQTLLPATNSPIHEPETVIVPYDPKLAPAAQNPDHLYLPYERFLSALGSR